MKLSRDAVQKARDYLFQHGRSLEQALWRLFFENGSLEEVCNEACAFQNPDGGYGHGIEPDLRTPDSSAIATSQALKFLRLAGAPPNHRAVANAVSYLLHTLDKDQVVWEIAPATVSDSPHAFWWAYDGLAERFGNYRMNPTVALVGHLVHYSSTIDAAPLSNLLDTCKERVAELSAKDGFYDLLCYVDLISAHGLSPDDRAILIERVSQVVTDAVERDPSKWGGHVLPPLAAITTADSPLRSCVPHEVVDQNLDFEIAAQQEDGSWAIPWTWEAADPAAWRRAEQDWKGIFIVQKVRQLASFGRLS